MKLVRGDSLTPQVRREVLAAFVHRHLDTRHTTDDSWLADHAFWITKSGRLARNRTYAEPAYMADDTCSDCGLNLDSYIDQSGWRCIHCEGQHD